MQMIPVQWFPIFVCAKVDQEIKVEQISVSQEEDKCYKNNEDIKTGDSGGLDNWKKIGQAKIFVGLREYVH